MELGVASGELLPTMPLNSIAQQFPDTFHDSDGLLNEVLEHLRYSHVVNGAVAVKVGACFTVFGFFVVREEVTTAVCQK